MSDVGKPISRVGKPISRSKGARITSAQKEANKGPDYDFDPKALDVIAEKFQETMANLSDTIQSALASFVTLWVSEPFQSEVLLCLKRVDDQAKGRRIVCRFCGSSFPTVDAVRHCEASHCDAMKSVAMVFDGGGAPIRVHVGNRVYAGANGVTSNPNEKIVKADVRLHRE